MLTYYELLAAWFAIRIVLFRTINFDFDMTHHYDFGFFAFVVPGVIYNNPWLIGIGVFIMIDDIIGHIIKTFFGGKEEFILEPLFRNILTLVYKIIGYKKV
jgi:hypothetical protein